MEGLTTLIFRTFAWLALIVLTCTAGALPGCAAIGGGAGTMLRGPRRGPDRAKSLDLNAAPRKAGRARLRRRARALRRAFAVAQIVCAKSPVDEPFKHRVHVFRSAVLVIR